MTRRDIIDLSDEQDSPPGPVKRRRVDEEQKREGSWLQVVNEDPFKAFQDGLLPAFQPPSGAGPSRGVWTPASNGRTGSSHVDMEAPGSPHEAMPERECRTGELVNLNEGGIANLGHMVPSTRWDAPSRQSHPLSVNSPRSPVGFRRAYTSRRNQGQVDLAMPARVARRDAGRSPPPTLPGRNPSSAFMDWNPDCSALSPSSASRQMNNMAALPDPSDHHDDHQASFWLRRPVQVRCRASPGGLPILVPDDLDGARDVEEGGDIQLANRLQAEEDARAAESLRMREEAQAQLRARMDQLEAFEAMAQDDADYGYQARNLRRSRGARGHNRSWGTLALNALMAIPPWPAGVRRGAVPESVQEAMLGMTRTGLPPHLLFTDRDFTPDDYEWLCRLDDTVENRKGASQTVIESLPTQLVEPGETEVLAGEKQRCTVCLEDFMEGAVLRRLPCAHKFHKECIDCWLKQKATCPICQRDCI